MSSLNDIETQGDDALVAGQDKPQQIEPLDGPTSPEGLMDRFPEEIYQQGRDTHLFHFIQALCGDSGAGIVTKMSYHARLPQEASLLEFSDLDNLYTQHFNFKRLPFEMYEAQDDQFNTQDVWDDMQRRDKSYLDRFVTFMKATEFGCAPEGLALAASAGIGAQVDLVENYNFIFDQYSDCQLGISQVGRSTSPTECTLVPRLFDADGNSVEDIDGEAITYKSTFRQSTPDITVTVPDAATRATLSNPIRRNLIRQIEPLTSIAQYEVSDEEDFFHLKPELEHNALQLVDRIKSVNTYVSLDPQAERQIEVTLAADPIATSEMFTLLRFVNGRSEVQWPEPNSIRGFFIAPNVENEAPHINNRKEWPVIFMTIDSAIAYDWRALVDDDYGTAAFYNSGDDAIGAARSLVWRNNPPPLAKYISFHNGPFGKIFAGTFASALSSKSPSATYPPSSMIAKNNTPLLLISERKAR